MRGQQTVARFVEPVLPAYMHGQISDRQLPGEQHNGQVRLGEPGSNALVRHFSIYHICPATRYAWIGCMSSIWAPISTYLGPY